MTVTVATVDGGDMPPAPSDDPAVLVIVVGVVELHAAGVGSLADRLLDATGLGWRCVVVDLTRVRHLDVLALDRVARRWIERFDAHGVIRLVPGASAYCAALLSAAGIPARLLAPSRAAALAAVAGG